MADKTVIAWTDHTFNGWMGCFKVSQGCKNCYADALTTNRMGLDVFGADTSKRQRTGRGVWSRPARWNREAQEGVPGARGVGPHMVFCASLSDVFEDAPGPNEWREDVWALIRECKWLDWQLLTKRPENIERMLPDDWADNELGYYPNVWLGTSIETALGAPAAARWVADVGIAGAHAIGLVISIVLVVIFGLLAIGPIRLRAWKEAARLPSGRDSQRPGREQVAGVASAPSRNALRLARLMKRTADDALGTALDRADAEEPDSGTLMALRAAREQGRRLQAEAAELEPVGHLELLEDLVRRYNAWEGTVADTLAADEEVPPDWRPRWLKDPHWHNREVFLFTREQLEGMARMIGYRLTLLGGMIRELAPLPAEYASPKHRNDIRRALQACQQAMQFNGLCSLGDEVAAHYGLLVGHVEDWNGVVERWRQARRALQDRFGLELVALGLDDRYIVSVIRDCFAGLTEQRALDGKLDEAHEHLWSVYQPQANPPDGVHVTGFREVAITLSPGDEDYEGTAERLIAVVQPVWNAAQNWPEPRAIAFARGAMGAFDRQSIYDEIAQLVRPERIWVAEGCPACWEVG